MECHQFQKFKKCMHFSIKVRALLQIVRALLQIVRALLQIVRALLQMCVHFYQLCVHFYNCACTFTNCACTFTKCACTSGLMKLMARYKTEGWNINILQGTQNIVHCH